ncbi:SdpI family protein [Aureibacter tunicatorum]|uniref:Membrane protein n=1 Tax=Aureibacter tunicatorum TaxID=866807 RepID=A0AAE3XJX9_9BACT|nr:SdpI family protein [Aureibacter tunicatorum]MDR6237151.1 putative membrane protein [Aureibacter tunicatorum]
MVSKLVPSIILASIPPILLIIWWPDFSEPVPIHWNYKGEADQWGTKNSLILISLIPFIIYGIMMAVPFIDPKKRILEMGNKFYNLSLGITLFLTIISCFIMVISKSGQTLPNNLIIGLLGGLFAFLGNYMKTVKPNYFIGIKTPWTLENETVWKKTHLLGGKLWFIGGISILVLSLILTPTTLFIAFISIILVITLIPFTYSFIIYKSLPKGTSKH